MAECAAVPLGVRAQSHSVARRLNLASSLSVKRTRVLPSSKSFGVSFTAFSRPEVVKTESASRLKIVAQAQAGAGAGSSPEPKAVSTTEAEDAAFKLKIGGYFALWWTLNVVFNIYNKKVLNAFPFPWLCSTLALAAGVTIMLLSWATRLVEFPDTDLDFWKTLFPV
ncbi:unnamed protein product, partial [Closterium sp. NIES-65]